MAGTRIYGPYPHKRGGFEVILIEPPEPGEQRGPRSARRFASEEEAHRWIASLEKELQLEGPITIEGALDAFAEALDRLGNRASSLATTRQRLLALHASGTRQGRLQSLDAAHCTAAYRSYADAVSADTGRNALAEAKRFGRWCVKQGWIRRSPWEAVEPVGRRKRGKVQLRVDEARRWLAKAVELAEGGDDGAVAAMMCLLLGLRASEVVERVGRDVDDGGTLLWIDRAKTEAGRRAVAVPGVLAPLLARLSEGRSSGPLFAGAGRMGRPRDRHWVAYHFRRVCRLAGVEVICPQGARGTQASLASGAGATPQLVAATLGHASTAVTLAHYARPEAVASGRAGRALRVLQGGGEKLAKNTKGVTGGSR